MISYFGHRYASSGNIVTIALLVMLVTTITSVVIRETCSNDPLFTVKMTGAGPASE